MCNEKFRRQHPIGPYFVDFCSIERNLIVEVDGGQHAEQSADDEARSSFLRSLGYRVLSLLEVPSAGKYERSA
jgi:very-short-patch-repair endonuclease